MARQKRYWSMPAIDQPDPEPGFQHNSDEFIIPAIDEEGESLRCQFRAPAQLVGWAGQIVLSKKFPFQREGDLMRYGLFLACQQLARIDNEVPNLEGQVLAAAQTVRSRQNAANVSKHLDQLTAVLADLQKQKAWGEITYLLASERRFAEAAIPSEPYWGKLWLNSLEDRFGDLRRLAESKLEYVHLLPSAPPKLDEENGKSDYRER